jgi:hypothetical protein
MHFYTYPRVKKSVIPSDSVHRILAITKDIFWNFTREGVGVGFKK